MPFNPVLDGSTPNATAFAANAAPESQSKGMPRVGTPAPPFTAKAVIDGRIKGATLRHPIQPLCIAADIQKTREQILTSPPSRATKNGSS